MGYMRKPLLMIAIVALFALAAATSTTSPRDVVDQFVKMDLDGARLTPEGWHTADALFVKHSEPYRPDMLIVVGRSYAVSEGRPTNTNEFYFGYEEVARISAAALRFYPTHSGVETRSFDKYVVVPSATDASDKNVEAPSKVVRPEWRIDGAQPKTIHLTAKAAIQYLTQMRAKTSDPATQSNASRAISNLAPYE
jgi:hypothetical protein